MEERYQFIVKDETGRVLYRFWDTPERGLWKLKKAFFGGGNGRRKNNRN